MIFKKKEKVGEELSLSLDELERFLALRLEEESREVIAKANDMLNHISSIISSISNIGREIELIKLDRDEVATQYINAMNNTKRNLLAVIDSIKRIPSINDTKDLDHVKDGINSILTKLGEVTGSHRRVIYELFPTQAKRLKSELERLKEDSERLNSIVDDYNERVLIFKKSKERIASITNAEREIARVEEERQDLALKIKTAKTKEDHIIKRLEEARGDREYTNNITLLNKLKDEYKALLYDLNQSYSNITRVINKYDYTLGIEKVKRGILLKMDKPSTITSDELPILTELLNDILKSIRDSRIELKNAEKAISNLEGLIRRLPDYIVKAKEYEQSIDDVINRVRPLDDGIKRFEHDLNIIRSEIEMLNARDREYTNRVEELNRLINNNIDGIRSDLEKVMMRINVKR